MARHKRKLKVNKLLMPVALILVVAVFVLAAAMYGLSNAPPPKKELEPASEYFEFIQPTVTDYEGPMGEHNETYIIKGIGFQIKPVKGDAHGIAIGSWAAGEPVEVGDLKQGETKWVEVRSSSFGLPVQPVNGTQFQVTIQVNSAEAAGKVTLTIL